MTYSPLHHKYRPQTFADLVGQDAIATTLRNAIRTSRIAPAYLFAGSRGTGKTSSARILAKSLNCLSGDKPTEQPCGVCDVCQGIANSSSLDVTEIDAASNTGVDNIREVISAAQFTPVQCRYKVYILDEAQMLSTAAFNSLLKTLEEPPVRVVFVLATTEPQRIPPTIISRCQRYDFRRISLEAMVAHLRAIADKETINITNEAVTMVAQIAQGGLRDAESLLDQLSLTSGQVTVERVWDLVGAVPEQNLMGLLEAIAANNAEAVLERGRKIMDSGKEPSLVLSQLAGFYRDLLIAKTAPSRTNLVAITPTTWTAMCEFARRWDTATILAGQKHLKDSEVQIKNTTQPRLWLEVTLMGLLLGTHSNSSLWTNPSSAPCSVFGNKQLTQELGECNQLPTQHSPLPPGALPHDTSSTGVTQTRITPPEETPKVREPKSHEHPELSSTSHHTTDTALASPDLNPIWQQVLRHLKPPFTQGLLRTHGRLTAFDDCNAVVCITSEPLLKKVADSLPNLEKAFFEATSGKPIKVSLVVKN